MNFPTWVVPAISTTGALGLTILRIEQARAENRRQHYDVGKKLDSYVRRDRKWKKKLEKRVAKLESTHPPAITVNIPEINAQETPSAPD